MVIALKGENGRAVIRRIKDRLAAMRLPPGYTLHPFYDQSEIIDGTIRTVLHNLLEAGLLVAVILLVFLGDLRAALIVAAMIPLSVLFGFIGMTILGVSANLMSLGTLDFGMIVDGSVVMIENSAHRNRASRQPDCWIPSERHRTKWRGRSFSVWLSFSRYICRFSRW
jgi:cobalt-zinc-cadmium resistance protein CzcA